MPNLRKLILITPDITKVDGLERHKFWSKILVKSKEECWPWIPSVYKNVKDHPTIKIERTCYKVSRIMYLFHYKEDPGELCVCHNCNNRICCNPYHFYLATNGQNVSDAYDDGLHGCRDGELAHHRILTEEEVIEIRDLYKTRDYTQAELAKLYLVHPSNISLIVSGKNWKHLPV